MIGRLFWFLVGIGVAVFVYKKVREYMAKATPEAIGHRVAESASGHRHPGAGLRSPRTRGHGRA